MASTEQILKWYDEEMRRNPPVVGQARVEQLPSVTRIVWDGEVKMGAVQYSRLEAGAADEQIAEQCRYFGASHLDFEWKLYSHDEPADLGTRLAAFKGLPDEPESLVALDLSLDLSVPELPGLTIDRLQKEEEFEEIARVNRAVWDLDNEELVVALKEEWRAAPDRLSLYIVHDGRTPVATGWVRFYPRSRFADLWGGSTLRDYRGRGIYRALVGLRAREAKGKGASYLCVDASEMSRPILEKLGFQKLCTTTPYYFSWKDQAS